MDVLWNLECQAIVGPIVGHANNGDNRICQLMLAYYTIQQGLHLKIEWPRWLMSTRLNEAQDVWGLHDQDYIHNGKKFINPLDSPMRSLQLGAKTCFDEHIGLVYNKYTFDQHGLRLEDIQRTNRQKWAYIQRIYQLKVHNCLKML
jgi:hypothetical protein